MTRGQAQSHIPSAPTVHVFPDGGTVLSTQPVEEASRALAEAASHQYVDMKRRAFDEAVENRMARFGFANDGSRL